ncbi:carbohydrate esterase family 2 protein [Parathielavia appendiculata]|uniref:Carbohydrate esterase family 2 protein n=1 Tax=Parathielavia appendiculata TaxID=2587402 RepID=A0AAN6U188_9PEZI|nr:carbohydrate esterase family 2 protein [Parathielavia appendiculata]
MRLSVLILALASVAAAAPSCQPRGQVRYLGRVNPATKELSWPSTGVSFAFTGTSATIGITAVSGTNSADLIIDDGEPVLLSNFVAGTPISTPTLPRGNHTVVLRRRSEPAYGSMSLGDITTDGHLLPAPAAPKRQIEIIGDSITVGYGLDGTHPCTNTAELENSPKTYGALAANSLGADYSIIAWSGKGLVRNIASATPDTSPVMPQLYTRYGAEDADNSYPFPASWSPDAVVINLGTNDFSYIAWDASGQPYNARATLNMTQYVDGMVQFVRNIEKHYPAAHFFLVSSPMLNDGWPTTADAQKTTQVNALKEAVARLGAAKAHFVDWPSQGAEVGCDYHPNAATNAAFSATLAEVIAGVLDW